MNVVQQVASIVEEAKNKAISLLANSDFAHRQQEFTVLFKHILTRCEHMGAILIASEKNQPFPPITEFMGEKIKVDSKVTLKDLTNSKDAEQKYKADRDNLYNQILNFSADQVLHTYRLPEHQLILRGVAKKAGLSSYKDHPLTIQFVEDIKVAIASKNGAEQKQAEIDKSIVSQNNIGSGVTGETGSNGNLHALTLEEFTALTTEQKEELLITAEIEPTQLKTAEEYAAADPAVGAIVTSELREYLFSEVAKAKAAKQTIPTLLTQEEINNTPELQKLKAKPGMEIFTDKNGNKGVRFPKQ